MYPTVELDDFNNFYQFLNDAIEEVFGIENVLSDRIVLLILALVC